MNRKKKTLILLILPFICLLGYLIFCMVHTSQSEILKKAIYFDGKCKKTHIVTKIGIYIKNLFFSEKQIIGKKKYSHNNFSFFIVSKSMLRPKVYELYFSSTLESRNASKIYMENYKTVCSLENITEQSWNWRGGDFEGSFSFMTPYGLSGRLLFEGTNKQIIKMVIAKKGSDKLKDGYAVFGCKYGRNAFEYIIYPNEISLPKSQIGEYLTYDNYNPNSLIISMYSNGDINIGGSMISMDQLDQIIQSLQQSFCDIFLWIDKNCPEQDVIDLIKLIEHDSFKTYQVFLKENEDYYIVCPVKQITEWNTRGSTRISGSGKE